MAKLRNKPLKQNKTKNEVKTISYFYLSSEYNDKTISTIKHIMEAHQMIIVCAMSELDNIMRFSIFYYNFTYKRTQYKKYHYQTLEAELILYIYDTTKNVHYQFTYIVTHFTYLVSLISHPKVLCMQTMTLFHVYKLISIDYRRNTIIYVCLVTGIVELNSLVIILLLIRIYTMKMTLWIGTMN